ncbi:MAG: 6-hydroxymethylpterin diphosphokinase MptE-like protein [Spirochaetales bacterium]
MNALLGRNLEQLPTRVRELIKQAQRLPELVIREARNGALVLGLRRGGREMLFHSRYDPQREANRLAATVPAGACVVAFGFGAGHHLTALIETKHRVIVVEPNLPLLRAALERADFADALSAGSLQIAVGTPIEVELQIRGHFVPGIDERLVVVELPGRVSCEPESFVAYRAIVRRLVEDYASDIATQARFAKRWMKNTLGNLSQLAITERPLSRLPRLDSATVCIVAAGPSLTSQLEWIACHRESLVIVAVDTALPILTANGLSPDLVTSIDCQVASYHHYLVAAPVSTPVVVELSAPRALIAAAQACIPIGSSHPFHRFLHRMSLPFPTISTGSGTVTGATIELAHVMKAESLILAGVDSSYPRGELYPRGSYAHHFFDAHSTRLSPTEARMRGFLWSRPEVAAEGQVWTTPQLRGYHHQLKRRLNHSPIAIYEMPGHGLPLGFPAPTETALSPITKRFTPVEIGPLRPQLVAEVLTEFLRLTEGITDRESLERGFYAPERHGATAAIVPVVLHASRELPTSDHDTRVRTAVDWIKREVLQTIRAVAS